MERINFTPDDQMSRSQHNLWSGTAMLVDVTSPIKKAFALTACNLQFSINVSTNRTKEKLKEKENSSVRDELSRQTVVDGMERAVVDQDRGQI